VLYERPPQFPLPDGWGFRVIVAIASLMRSFGALLAMFSVVTLVDFFYVPFMAFVPLPRDIGPSLLRAVPEVLICVPISWVLLRFGHRLSLRELGIHSGLGALKEFAIFTLAGAVSVSLVVLPLILLGLGAFRQSEARIHNPWIVLLCVLLLFLASCSEELVMRGYAFQSLIQPLHLLGALIATSSIFAVLHLWNPWASECSIANTFLAGCVLGMILVVRRSLWAAIGAHFGWNTMTPFLGVNLSGMPLQITGYSIEWRGDPTITGGGYGPEGSIVCTALLLILLFFLIWLYYRPKPIEAVAGEAV
jgi:hypothetical protein